MQPLKYSDIYLTARDNLSVYYVNEHPPDALALSKMRLKKDIEQQITIASSQGCDSIEIRLDKWNSQLSRELMHENDTDTQWYEKNYTNQLFDSCYHINSEDLDTLYYWCHEHFGREGFYCNSCLLSRHVKISWKPIS